MNSEICHELRCSKRADYEFSSVKKFDGGQSGLVYCAGHYHSYLVVYPALLEHWRPLMVEDFDELMSLGSLL